MPWTEGDALTPTNLNAINALGGVWFNVQDPLYGAKGDGVTDDTAAIQAAINAAAAVRGTVYLPAPSTSYVFTNLLVNANMRIKGPSMGAAVGANPVLLRKAGSTG